MFNALAYDFTYLDIVCTDCGVFSEEVSNYLIEAARQEYALFTHRDRVARVKVRLDRVEHFIHYLQEEEQLPSGGGAATFTRRSSGNENCTPSASLTTTCSPTSPLPPSKPKKGVCSQVRNGRGRPRAGKVDARSAAEKLCANRGPVGAPRIDMNRAGEAPELPVTMSCGCPFLPVALIGFACLLAAFPVLVSPTRGTHSPCRYQSPGVARKTFHNITGVKTSG
jgi:hypothetical protein